MIRICEAEICFRSSVLIAKNNAFEREFETVLMQRSILLAKTTNLNQRINCNL